MSPLEGVLVADKPPGPTSHDIVEQVRRHAGGMRVGHTGTLDPFATGVLPLCIGRATRLARFLAATRKVYSGTIRLGVSTDTYDAEGRVTATRPIEAITEATAREAAGRFTGDLLQAPPAFSARKVMGEPMHRLARAGIEVPRKPTPVTIYRFEIMDFAEGLLGFEAETSPGTYIRSLAHDLGEALGCGGHLTRLRRLASGSFDARAAHSMEEIHRRGADGSLPEIVIPLNDLDLGLPSVSATAQGAAAMRHGRALTLRDVETGGPMEGPPRGAGLLRVADDRGNLLGVARAGTGPGGEPLLRPEVVLNTR